ncbi:MAG: maleylpyruvate isomerase N-terminal domain-containing protein [Pseudonocardiales bacterium]
MRLVGVTEFGGQLRPADGATTAGQLDGIVKPVPPDHHVIDHHAEPALDVSDRYRQLSAAFADKITAIPPDRWSAATPCTDWNVRDLVRHVLGWDLARATGQDERIDPWELARLWESVKLFGDAIRTEGTCGPAVDPPPGADDQTRLLAYLGRPA